MQAAPATAAAHATTTTTTTGAAPPLQQQQQHHHQSSLKAVFPCSKPRPMIEDGVKRKRPADLRVQALLAQEASKLQGLGENAGATAVEQQQQRPATDFAGFFEQVGHEQQQQQQQQQQQAGGQQQQAGGRAASALDQLINQHSLVGVAAPRCKLQHVASLDRALFAPDASRDGFLGRSGGGGDAAAVAASTSGGGGATASGAAGAAAAGPERWHLSLAAGLLPWDWSVKARVRVSSRAAFAVLEQRRAAGLGPACRAVAAAGGGGGAADDDSSDDNAQERLAAALMQWQHPASPLNSTALAALRAADAAAAGSVAGAGAGLVAARTAAWREALRGAYASVRHGRLPLLYVVGQAFRQPFVAVLCARGQLGCARPHALVSRSNRALRAHLASHGATWVTMAAAQEQQLCAPGGAANGAAAAAAAAPAAGTRGQQPQAAAGAADGQPGSMLLLRGAAAVHGLYAALLDLPWCAAEQPDVPLLSAPAQFPHAALAPLRLEPLPDAVLDAQQQQQQQQQAGGGGGGAALLAPLHYAELLGPGAAAAAAGGSGGGGGGGAPIMPWTLHRLLCVLRDTQAPAGGFDAHLETDPSSSSLNLLPDAWAAADAAAAAADAAGDDDGANAPAPGTKRARRAEQQQQPWPSEGDPAATGDGARGLSAPERAAWRPSLEALQGRVLRHVRVGGDGCVSARLA